MPPSALSPACEAGQRQNTGRGGADRSDSAERQQRLGVKVCTFASACLKPGGRFRLKRGAPRNRIPGRGLRINCVDRFWFRGPVCFNTNRTLSFSLSTRRQLSFSRRTQTTRGTLFSRLPEFKFGGTNPFFLHLGKSAESLLDFFCGKFGGTNPFFLQLGKSAESLLDFVCGTSLNLFFGSTGLFF